MSRGMTPMELHRYLLGIFDVIDEPTPAQIKKIREAVISTVSIGLNPGMTAYDAKQGDCGCGGSGHAKAEDEGKTVEGPTSPSIDVRVSQEFLDNLPDAIRDAPGMNFIAES